jgi:Novel STAND NTPase 1
MDSDELAHLHDLIRVYTRRFRKLELEAAKLGANTPPHIQTELDEIQEKLDELDQKARAGAQAANVLAYEVGANPASPDADGVDAASRSELPGRVGCPYPGMAPFRAEDADCFYGREAEIQQMLQHLRHRRLLFVIGPSGSGKSSLIHAGLLPRLRQSGYFPPDFWRVRVLRPGEQPLQALAAALDGEIDQLAQALSGLLAAHPPADRLLLVIDQLEELFTQTPREEQPRFVAAIQALQAQRACTLLIAMRADFYADLMSTDLWPLAPGQRLEIAPLRGAALRRAIEQPAADIGVRLESGLIERLLADAADEPGALPLVQETMTVLWAEMRERVLPLGAYERLGRGGRSGLAVALAAKADAALDDLTPAQRRIAGRIFLRLVQFCEGRADTRRQQSLAALRSASDDPELFDATLRHLVDNRLLTVDDETVTDRKAAHDPESVVSRQWSVVGGRSSVVDLAHEALIAGWPTLQGWLAERREAEQARRRLEAHVAEWIRLGQGSGGLFDEVELAEVERWLAGAEAAEVGFDPRLLELVQASRAAIAEGVLRQLSEEARRLKGYQ